MNGPALEVFICFQHIDGHVVLVEEERHGPAFIRGILKGMTSIKKGRAILLFDTMSWVSKVLKLKQLPSLKNVKLLG